MISDTVLNHEHLIGIYNFCYVDHITWSTGVYFCTTIKLHAACINPKGINLKLISINNYDCILTKSTQLQSRNLTLYMYDD